MPPIRDTLWLIALVIMALAWWADHSRLVTRVRSHEAARSAHEREIENWKMEIERLREQTAAQPM